MNITIAVYVENVFMQNIMGPGMATGGNVARDGSGTITAVPCKKNLLYDVNV